MQISELSGEMMGGDIMQQHLHLFLRILLFLNALLLAVSVVMLITGFAPENKRTIVSITVFALNVCLLSWRLTMDRYSEKAHLPKSDDTSPERRENNE